LSAKLKRKENVLGTWVFSSLDRCFGSLDRFCHPDVWAQNASLGLEGPNYEIELKSGHRVNLDTLLSHDDLVAAMATELKQEALRPGQSVAPSTQDEISEQLMPGMRLRAIRPRELG
jgi:hypothetical protein